MEYPHPPATQPKTSAAAIWSLVLGILAIVLCLNVITAIPGIILGIVSLSKINASRGALGGKGLAIAGIVCSCAGIVLTVPILAALALPAYRTTAEKSRISLDSSHVRLIVLTCKSYAADNDGLYPESSGDRDFQTSTEVFNHLLQEGYVDDESIFWRPVRPGEANPPQNDGVLTREENGYLYVAGQTDTSFAGSPLVANRMEEPGIYGIDHPWLRARKVVVGYCGGQVVVESLDSNMPGAVAVSRDGAEIFDPRENGRGGALDVPVDRILLP